MNKKYIPVVHFWNIYQVLTDKYKSLKENQTI